MTAASTLTDSQKQDIQAGYSAWLDARGFKSRRGQREMIAAVARTLSGPAPRIAVIEAGTGTGKTAGYVIPAVPIAQALGKQIVIGTATVALQEQVVFRDLPDLKARTELNFSFEIAKGRGRYVCLKRLDDALRADGGQSHLLFAEHSGDHSVLFQSMMTQFGERSWNGERDAWDGELDADAWLAVTTDHRGCTNRRCGFFKQCPFFKARAALEGVTVIVANQDLILADLSLGGGAVLPEPNECIYVIDEAHHLPDKTQQHFSARARIDGTRSWTEQLAGGIGTMAQRFGRPQVLVDAALKVEAAGGALIEALAEVSEVFAALPFVARDDMLATYRFPLGLVPAEQTASIAACQAPVAEICATLVDLRELIGQAAEGEMDWLNAHEAEDWLPVLGQFEGRAVSLDLLIRDYARADRVADPELEGRQARWVNRSDADVELITAPLDPGRLLQERFWMSAFGVILTSATLTALGSFDRFLEKAGLRGAVTHRFPSPFDYPRIATLVVPSMQSDPRDADAHTAEVAALLPELLRVGRSALVLFTSWRQMRSVAQALDGDLMDRVQMQGEGSKQALLAAHRAAIDDDRDSYLFGLQSFAEGVDLPDDYCRHVIIAKLPFSVPDDPLDQALAEWLKAEGRNPFYDLQVPDAALRLEQACGRLIRHEQDHGRITLLDRRIVSKSYGRALLQSLPPYRLQVE